MSAAAIFALGVLTGLCIAAVGLVTAALCLAAGGQPLDEEL